MGSFMKTVDSLRFCPEDYYYYSARVEKKGVSEW
jgi:hypothetical protein